MNKNSRRLTIYVTLVSLLTVLSLGFRTAACLTSLDIEYGYFNEKAFINTAGILLFGAILVAFSFAVSGQKISLRPSFCSPATFVPTGIVGAALLFFAARLFKEVGVIFKQNNGFLNLRNMQGASSQIVLFATALICALGALLSILHFFLNAFITEAKTELRAYFAIATVITLSAYAAYLYFAGGTSINAPNKITDQMAYLFSALFFLYEARISLGRERWRGYCVFGLAAAACAAYSSIPSLILYFAKGTLLSKSLEETVLTLSLFIFITARVVMTITLRDTEKNGKIAVIEDRAEQIRRAASDTERRYDERYAIQLTIDDMIPDGEMPHAAEDYEPSDEFVFPDEEELSTVFVTDDDGDDDDGQMELVPDVFKLTGEEGEDDDGGEDDGTED